MEANQSYHKQEKGSFEERGKKDSKAKNQKQASYIFVIQDIHRPKMFFFTMSIIFVYSSY